MRVIKPPTPVRIDPETITVFLAGSIEMGGVEDWQSLLTNRLKDLPIVVLNPRRDEWDSSWKETIDDPQFRQQVEWELNGMEQAGVIAMWFHPETKAPITLLELGLSARTGKLIVGCPEGFWRKGNVEIACERFRIPLLTDFDTFVEAVIKRVTRGHE